MSLWGSIGAHGVCPVCKGVSLRGAGSCSFCHTTSDAGGRACPGGPVRAMSTDYRKYTTAELRDMPDTARLEDRKGNEWIRMPGTFELSISYACWVPDVRVDLPCYVWYYYGCELARRLLRRIA